MSSREAKRRDLSPLITFRDEPTHPRAETQVLADIPRILGLLDLIFRRWEPRDNKIYSHPAGNSQKGGLVDLAAPKLAALR